MVKLIQEMDAMNKYSDAINKYSIARQPILDHELQQYAYELLFRQHKQLNGNISLTSEVLATAIFDIGLETVTGNTLAFINMSYQDLMNPTIDALPSNQLVLELLEDIKIDNILAQRVQELAEKGFVIALDDFVYSPEWEPLIDAASIIKLDLTVSSVEENRAVIDQLQGRSLKFLAEKVETYEDFQLYRDMGCDYFQGYFFCRPEPLEGRSLTSNSLTKIRLLTEINDPNTSADKLNLIIQQDPSLSFKLLKYLNSAFFAFSTPIKNIKQAIILIGIQGVKKWTTLLTLRNLSSHPSELTKVSLIRAKLAERIAIDTKAANPETYFLAGLFSTLDAMLDASMEDILSSMPLDIDLKNALSKKQGKIGEVLKFVMEYEESHLLTLDKHLLSNDEYLNTCIWADEAMSSL